VLLQQVVRNTLANAVKFAPEGSKIVLDATLDDDGGAHISVRDHGPGIPPKELEKIFEAFVQSSKTKDGSGGTGLGLAICRKIVSAHGGSIHAENMPDGGSRFHIQLPHRDSGETIPAELTA
jgi:signal transduction histidine kinase